MNLAQAILLGILQGLTEFLPVSSSGHLVIMQDLLGVRSPGITFEVMVHFGTMLAVVAAYREDVIRILSSLASGLRKLMSGYSLGEALERDPHARLGLLIAIGTIPTAVIAYGMKSFVEETFESSLFAGFMLLITGVILATMGRFGTARKNILRMSYTDALTIGIFQGLAVLPGISRSGSTIASGLFMGLEGDLAARFSFLLSLPAVLGATLLDLADIASGTPAGVSAAGILAGTLAAFISGWIAIRLMLQVIRRQRLILFAYYVWAVGLLTILWKL